MLASSYPLLDVFWTMLWFFAFFIWIYLLIMVLSDIFRSDDLSGWGKALWTIFVIILPLIGVLAYLIARGDSMQKRRAQAAEAARKQNEEYIRQAAGTSTSAATELSKLVELRDSGKISDAEFQSAKSKILAA